jgi:parafibromin
VVLGIIWSKVKREVWDMSVWQIGEVWWTSYRARGMALEESSQRDRIGVSVTKDRTIGLHRLMLGVAALEPAASAASATVESLPSALDHEAGPSKVAAPVKRKYEVDVKDREFCKRVRRANRNLSVFPAH